MNKKLELFEKLLLTFSNVDEFVTDNCGELLNDFHESAFNMFKSMGSLTDKQRSLLLSLVECVLDNGSFSADELSCILDEYVKYRYEQAAQEYIEIESPYANSEFVDEIADMFSDYCLWIRSEKPNYRPISFKIIYSDWIENATVSEILAEYDILIGKC